MTDQKELVALREEVLQKIGRNVVNFGKLEAVLKHLSAHHFSSPIREVADASAKAIEATNFRTLGNLVKELGETVYSSSHEPTFKPECKDVQIAFSFRVETDPTAAAATLERLQALVRDRNDLIHRRLAELDARSIESLNSLRDVLEDQHARLVPEYENLKCVAQTLADCRSELARWLSTDEFMSQFPTMPTEE